jgi:hypothetical protein
LTSPVFPSPYHSFFLLDRYFTLFYIVPIEAMKKEYDFSKAERGKFYRSDVQINLPVYLEPELKKHFPGGIYNMAGSFNPKRYSELFQFRSAT